MYSYIVAGGLALMFGYIIWDAGFETERIQLETIEIQRESEFVVGYNVPS